MFPYLTPEISVFVKHRPDATGKREEYDGKEEGRIISNSQVYEKKVTSLVSFSFVD